MHKMNKGSFFYFYLLFSLLSSTLSAENILKSPAITTLAEDVCELPAPAALFVTNVTNTTITINWTHVTGAVQYQITAFDMDNGVPLPTNIVTIPPAQPATYTLTNLPMATNIKIGVSATSCLGGNFGQEISLVQKTDAVIIVDIIVQSPCNPGSGNDVIFNNGSSDYLYINTTPVQQNPATYREATLKAYVEKSGNEWNVGVNLVGITCPSGSIKLVCNPTGLVNVDGGTPNPTQGTLTFKKTADPNVTALQIYDIQKVPNSSDIKFRVRTTDGNGPTCKYDPYCANTSLDDDPCYHPPYGYNYGGGGNFSNGNESREQIEIEVLPLEESITATPNPFNDFTNVQYQISKQSPVSMVLFNAMGQVQRELLNDTNVEPGAYTLPVDMADLAPGVYFLTIQTESGRKITTVVKQ